MNPIKQRKEIERQIIQKIIRRKRTFIFDLSRTESGRMLSFSPYEAYKKTNLAVSRYLRYKYSHLSKQIHEGDDNRSAIIKEIDKIIPVSFNQYVHLCLNEFLENTDAIIIYCDKHGFGLPNKNEIKRLRKLIRKWKQESQNLHYKMSKQEKRKLKKIKKTKKITPLLYYEFLERQE